MPSPTSEQAASSPTSTSSNGTRPTSPENKAGIKSSDRNTSAASFTSNKKSRTRLDKQKMSSASLRQQASNRKFSSASLGFAHVDSSPSMASFDFDDIDLDKVPWWTSYRFRLALLCFSGFVCLYAQRVNLSIAIVSMVGRHHALHNQSDRNLTYSVTDPWNGSDIEIHGTTQAMPLEDSKCPTLSENDLKGEFDWSKEQMGLILGAFFWGYLVLQVPGGSLGERFGAKRVIAVCLFPVAILNILTPVVARASPYMLLVLRVLVGVGEGVMYPAAQALWANWSPPNERSRLIGFSYAGGQFGNAIIFPIGGLLCAYGADGGWPTVFYFIGTVSFFWCVLWVLFASDTPDGVKGISDIEKKYIKACIGVRTRSRKRKIPWKSIFTSKAVYAILVGHMCGNYGAYMLLTKIPSYMKEVLKFDIKANGMFSMMPYLAFWALITVSGMIADTLISREVLTIQNTRKLMSTIGMFGPAAFLIGTGFMECDQAIGAVAMLTISVGLCGFHFSGFFINHADIAPSFAGTLFGITNTMATIPGILSPYIVSSMTPNGTREEWLNTFYVAGGIYVFGAIVYLIFGQGEVQPWAMSEDEAKKKQQDDQDVGFALQDIREADEKEADEEEEEEDDELKGKKLLARYTKSSNGNSATDGTPENV